MAQANEEPPAVVGVDSMAIDACKVKAVVGGYTLYRSSPVENFLENCRGFSSQ